MINLAPTILKNRSNLNFHIALVNAYERLYNIMNGSIGFWVNDNLTSINFALLNKFNRITSTIISCWVFCCFVLTELHNIIVDAEPVVFECMQNSNADQIGDFLFIIVDGNASGFSFFLCLN